MGALDVSNIRTAAYPLLTHGTYGLSTLKTLLDAVEGKLDVPANFMADVSGLALEATLGIHDLDIKILLAALNDLSDAEVWAYVTRTLTPHAFPFTNPGAAVDLSNLQTAAYPRVLRLVSSMDFWAVDTPTVTLTTTATDDHALNSIVVSGIPADTTVIRVVIMLKMEIIKDTSTSDNAVNGATSFVVDADSGYASVVTAIIIPDDSWPVDVSEATERGGSVMLGNTDVKSEITGNGTWYGRFENIACDGNNLKLLGVSWGIRVYFTV